jgi:hypothetical protein
MGTLVITVAVFASSSTARGQCSNASLKGTYGVATHGERLGIYDTGTPPAIHFYATPLRYDEIAVETFDGAGNATQTKNIHLAGANVINTPDSFLAGGVGTYQVKPDCTGVELLTSGGQQYKLGFVLTDGGKGFHRIWISHRLTPLQAAVVPLPSGVTCDNGCDAAEQIFSEGQLTKGVDSAQVIWVQPGSLAGFGGAANLVVAGTAGGAVPPGTGVTLYWQDATAGSAFTALPYAPVPDSKGTWYNTIPNANSSHQYTVYAVYGDATSTNCTYAGDGKLTTCP